MKATRANLLGEFTGPLDGLIYYRLRPGGKLYVRRQWEFKNHPAHPGFASAQRQIFALQPSAAYICNLQDYLRQYNELPVNEQHPIRAWPNIYVKLMFALQKALPETVELKTITRTQIEQQNLPCRTLKVAIDAGLLPAVKCYARFTAEI